MRKLLLLSLFLAPAALADEYRPLFQWTGPTEFVSGAPLDPLTDLSEYRLYCSPAPQAGTIVLPNTDNSYQAPAGLFPPGDYQCYMTAVSVQGEESDPSNTKVFNVSSDRPAPIIIFEVQ